MDVLNHGIVCGELHAARQHLYDMVRHLSQGELLWVPRRRDGVSVSYHFGHIALVEDELVSQSTPDVLIASADLRQSFGAHNANNGAARLPSGDVIIDYMQRVRERTLGFVAVRFRAIRDAPQAVDAAELFRRIVNHEYMHTKYIRRICRELGKPEVEAPPSQLVIADADALAGPQYRLEGWTATTGGASTTSP
ncbi:MAG: DinB family protein [Deltaproteobacteria bacterium]|nr:DinB family protein [Deltaproteobacteria bacterium]